MLTLGFEFFTTLITRCERAAYQTILEANLVDFVKDNNKKPSMFLFVIISFNKMLKNILTTSVLYKIFL